MKKNITLITLLIFVFSCGVKQTRKSLLSGDYDVAINNSVQKLKNGKDDKGKQDYVLILEEAFAKAKERDLQNLNILLKESNPNNTEKIYNTYLQLNNRQEIIKPLLPLYLINEKRNCVFKMDDYSNEIVSSKNAFSKYLYNNAKALLATNDKMNYRRAYDDLMYLKSLNSSYENVNALIEEAQFKGTDFVNVFTKNQTNMIIPTRLENDLLDFSTFGLNDKWTVYHNNKVKNINYDYEMIVNFTEVNISPEQIKEKEFIKEKQLIEGTKPLLNQRGQVVKDSLGKTIMVDNFKTIKINIYEFGQYKSTQIKAKIDYVDFKNKQLIASFPISSEFVFENFYATYKGDKRACDESYLCNFENIAVPFPSNEQMVYDAGEDLKAKLKYNIVNHKFR